MTELNSRAQDAQIAEALGYKLDNDCYFKPEPTAYSRGTWQPMLRYSSDPVAFDSLMQEIGKRGLGRAFVVALKRKLYGGAFPEWYEADEVSNDEVWEMWSAPQSTKAQACLHVLGEVGNGK